MDISARTSRCWPWPLLSTVGFLRMTACGRQMWCPGLTHRPHFHQKSSPPREVKRHDYLGLLLKFFYAWGVFICLQQIQKQEEYMGALATTNVLKLYPAIRNLDPRGRKKSERGLTHWAVFLEWGKCEFSVACSKVKHPCRGQIIASWTFLTMLDSFGNQNRELWVHIEWKNDKGTNGICRHGEWFSPTVGSLMGCCHHRQGHT